MKTFTREELLADLDRELAKANLTYDEMAEIAENGCSRGCGCALENENLRFFWKALRPFL